MKSECAIVQDLIPLVNDGVASPESKAFVLEHCKHCETCKALLNQPPVYDENKITKKFKKQMRNLYITILFILVLFACSLSATMNQFNNFLLIPLVGALGYAALKQKVYLLFLAIPMSHLLMQFINNEYGSLLFYTIVYWLFMGIGIVIYKLYYYAFKGRVGHED